MAEVSNTNSSNMSATDVLLNLRQAVEGQTGAIRVMICRLWRLTNPFGDHTSIEIIASDHEGNVIQMHASGERCQQLEQDLVEGNIYRIEGFTAKPENSLYVNWSLNMHVIHLSAETSVTMLECPSDGFVRHPFSLTSFEAIRANRSSYIVDVVGLATNVGEITSTQVGESALQFDLINERGVPLRTMLLGNLAITFLNKQETENGVQVIILTSMQPKEFRGEHYLSSTCASLIYTEDEIPHISEFQSSVRNGTSSNSPFAPIVLPYKDTSLTQMLYLGRAYKAGGNKETTTLNCMATIKGIRGDKPWFYYWCSVCNSTKGVDEVGGLIWCSCCEDVCAVPLARLRLHLDVTDGDTTVVVVVPDEAADALLGISAATLVNNSRANGDTTIMPLEIQLLADSRHVFEIKSHTYLDHGFYESFVCSAIVKPLSHDQLGVVALTRNGSTTPYAMTTSGTLNSPYNPTRQLRVDEAGAASTSLVTPAQRAQTRRGLDFYSSDEE